VSSVLHFPSGRVVIDGTPQPLTNAPGGSVPAGLDSIAGAKPGALGILLFDTVARAYEETQKRRRELAERANRLHAAWVDAFDEYALAVQADVEARSKFKKAAAGIDPETGLTV